MSHLDYADAPTEVQLGKLIEIVRASPTLMQVFERARDLNLPDWWVVSGAIYNQVWNALTGRPDMYGVNDIDLFYYDTDVSYEAEDKVIRSATGFPSAPSVELRNQARVHLWYENHFGVPYAPLKNSREAIDRFACKTHCIGLRLRDDDTFDHYAPFGLNDIFSFRLTPHTARDNKETHERKARRQMACWPELTFVPWPA